MMKKSILMLVLALFLLIFPGKSEAYINFGFENGDLTGWNISGSGNAQVVNSEFSPWPWETTYTPQEGNKFLSLEVTGSWVKVWRNFTLEAGQKLCGMAAFDLRDIINDSASVRIKNACGCTIATPWYESKWTLGGWPYADGPWTYWEWTAPYSGSFKLEYYVDNFVTCWGDSYGFFDAYASPCHTPEPASMVLLGSGLLGLVATRRRKRRRL